MSIIKKTIFLLILILSFTSLNAQEIKKIGKFKDWETIVVTDETAKLCFAQSKPVLQSPKNNIREARAPKLADLDVEFQKALETGATTTDIVAKKQTLRDAPADSGIESASTADELKAQWKSDILGTSPYS